MFDNLKIAIIGTGQTGTAITAEIARTFPQATIFASDLNPLVKDDYYAQLRRLGIPSFENIHHIGPLYAGQICQELPAPDLVILAVPGSQQPHAVASIAPYLKPSSIVTDVCSAKQGSIDRLMPAIALLPFPVAYVPFHILNGFAGEGPLSAKLDILKAAGVIVPDIAPKHAEAFVAKFFEATSTKIHYFEAPKHDEVLSATSQLGYMVRFALADCDFIRHMPLGTADPGRWLRATLRIIDAGPEMWAANFTDCRNWNLKTAERFRALFAGTANNINKLDWRIDRAHDFAKLMPSPNVTRFELSAFNGQNLDNSAFTALLSIAMTENIFMTGERTGVDIPAICNPSAKDGMAPMTDPDMAKFLIRHRASVLQGYACHYLKKFDQTIQLVANLPNKPRCEGHRIVDESYDTMRRYVASFKPVDRYIKAALGERPRLLTKKQAFSVGYG